MSEIEFRTVDVFTTTLFGGNPLAVITDARGLSTDLMHSIAREFNYSESTFILPAADPSNTAHVRIFTPTQEVPFAGHPNVGTAYVLANLGNCFGKPVGTSMIFEEAAGLVKVETIGAGPGLRATITAPEPLSIHALNPAIDLSACVGLPATCFDTTAHVPVIASVGLPLVFVRVASLEALAQAMPNREAFARGNASWGIPELGLSIMLYTPVPDETGAVRARMFAPLDNIPEDPATGSASGALAGLIAHLDSASDGEFRVLIHQGVEMGRPSRIEVTATKRGGKVGSVSITGNCVAVMSGTLNLDLMRD